MHIPVILVRVANLYLPCYKPCSHVWFRHFVWKPTDWIWLFCQFINSEIMMHMGCLFNASWCEYKNTCLSTSQECKSLFGSWIMNTYQLQKIFVILDDSKSLQANISFEKFSLITNVIKRCVVLCYSTLHCKKCSMTQTLQHYITAPFI